MQLILIRHGQPLVGPDLAGDPPLSPEGQVQASITANLLAAEPIDRIVSSGMIRADATAAPLARALSLPIEPQPLIAETDRLTGRYASLETVRARGRDEWLRFLTDPLPYFGVDAAAFRADVLAGFAAILAGGGSTVAVFTHGFPINILLSHALRIPGEARFVLGYGSVTRLGARTLKRLTPYSINETAHIAAANVAAARVPA
ncbi:histidine phosphatase family protein [Sandaracinobacteroides saxicola]|uniref:Histidine phosphatase family protein n=1 Tax=Sandaracinobacteroides saxicola TaxID=2759707 RepID=A0A7G5IJH8_9SPHN|nr:histidine phosphatase family protein [Sandaracinobacteroides saxicola]QMW23520.1 histidine phosphatase family protein [Sandaracinobacteroides saxicola]